MLVTSTEWAVVRMGDVLESGHLVQVEQKEFACYISEVEEVRDDSMCVIAHWWAGADSYRKIRQCVRWAGEGPRCTKVTDTGVGFLFLHRQLNNELGVQG